MDPVSGALAGRICFTYQRVLCDICNRYTLTLQTTDKSVIPAIQAVVIREAVRQQLPQHISKLLSSTSVSFGKSATDFVYLNFSSI